MLEVDRIDWFESAGNYVCVHSAGGRTSCAPRWTEWRSDWRDATHHLRAAVGAILNVRSVATLERYGKGTYVVHFLDCTNVISSRY